MGLNRAMLLGNLGRDPELRHTTSGQSVTTFSIATSERWTDKAGQQQERTEWHRIVVWGKQGEMCAQYLKKGRQVFVEGRIQTREYQNKEGQKQFTTEIIANHVTFVGSRDGGGGGRGDDFGPPPSDYEQGSGGSGGGDLGGDDIPF